ncbi:MAG: hypothetical protein WCE94_10550 [Candidatus Methanoperedens sp.]
MEWIKPWSITSDTGNPAASSFAFRFQRSSSSSTPKETWSKPNLPLTGAPCSSSYTIIDR